MSRSIPLIHITATVTRTPYILCCILFCIVLFPYGINNGDARWSFRNRQQFQDVDDTFTYSNGPFHLDVPIVIFNRIETTFYVRAYSHLVLILHYANFYFLQTTVYGLIPFRSYFPETFPRVENFTSSFTRFQHSLVAPFWVQINSQETGYVYHRITEDGSALNKIAALIEDSNPGFGGFQPELAVIVTWEGIHVSSQVQVIIICIVSIKIRCRNYINGTSV